MKKMYRLLLLVFFLPLGVLAQQKTIKGKVTDLKNGQPLAGVTVTAGSGSAKAATATGADGEFTLTVPANTNEIIVSYVGYGEIKEKINNRDVINIRMNATPESLGEVVVVGYGTQKRATLTGSVSTLKGSEMTITKNENTLNMLTGKIPGLRMTQQSAEPGAYANNFDIRGYGAPPIIIIDGIRDYTGEFQRMDPNEIENVSVLKDAAAAVYGINGKNGAILITTKKGGNKNGKFDISYSFNQAIQQFLGMPQGVGAVDYMMLTNEKNRRDFGNNFVSNAPPTYSYDNIIPYINGQLTGANWINAAFNTTSPQVQHNLNISGGSDKVNAFINLGYTKQDGLLKSNALDYARWNLRSNVNMKITDRLRAQVLLSGYSSVKNQPYQDLWTIFKYAWNQIPINTIYANNNPNYLNIMPDNVNPVAVIDPSKVGYKKFIENNIKVQGVLEYDIPGIKGLKARGVMSYGYTVDNNTSSSSLYNLYSYNPVDSSYTATPVTATAQQPALNLSFGNTASTVTQLSLNYANTFNKVHNVTALLLYEQSQVTGNNFSAQRTMVIPSINLNAGSGVGMVANGNYNDPVQAKGVVGRINYDYKGKYLAEFSFRDDGTNYFQPGHRQWGLFPAGSVGWRVSEEPFFKNHISPNVISNLKIRASYGITGGIDQDPGSERFAYSQGYTYPTVDPADQLVLGYMMNGQFINGTATLPPPNPEITWSTSHTTNLALDFTVLKNKIDGTIEVYRRDVDGIPALPLGSLPGTVGTGLPTENLNSNRTQGIELSLSYKNRIGRDIGILLAGNVSYERTRNLIYTEGYQGNQYLAWKNDQTDRNTNILWGTDYGGQYTSYGQIYNSNVNSGSGNNSVLPGDYYMQDWNGDGVINGDDYHPIAINDLPLINFGFNVGITYKNIDISALFAGAAGVWTEYGEQLGQPLMYGRSALSKFLDSWHTVDPYANEYDPNTQWIAGKYPSMGYDYSQIQNSTKGIVNASYVRLKTIEIGYSLPHRLLQKIGVKNCRFYVNGYNLLTFTGLEDGVDPEHPGSFPNASFTDNNAYGGYQYPLNKTFNLGANITF